MADNPYAALVPVKTAAPAPKPEANPYAALVPTTTKPAEAPKNPRDAAGPAPEWSRNVGGDILNEYHRQATENTQALKQDFSQPLDKKKGVLALPARAGKTALDALSYLATPVDAAATSLIGRPIETGTGGAAPRKLVGSIASAAIPIVGEAGAARAGAKLAQESGLSYNAARRVAPEIAKNVAAQKLAAKPPGPVAKTAGTLQRAFDPANVSQASKNAAALHREVLGQRGIQSDIETHKLVQHARTLSNMTPEAKLDFLNYVENRSSGAKLADEKLKPAADAIQGVAKRYQDRISTTLGEDGPTFIKDYYSHMWKDNPGEVQRAMLGNSIGGKQGNARNLRARSIPTYADGIKAGLTPKFDNPIDAMVAYNDNMARYLGTHDIKDQMIKQNLASWHAPGSQPAGYVELQGMGTSRVPKGNGTGAKPSTMGAQTDDLFAEGADPMAGRRTDKVKLPPSQRTPRDQEVREQKLYANPDAARIYNNHLSKGFNQGDTLGPAYRATRSTLNGLMQLKLGLSAFHGSVMAREGIIGEMAKGIGQVSRGKPLEGLKTMATAPGAPVSLARKGSRMFGDIVGKSEPTGEAKVLNDLYAKAGGRLGMDKIYSVRGAGSLYDGIKRGTFRQDLNNAVKRTYEGPALERAKGVVDLAGNLIESVSGPLFKDYIPAMKRGAWSSRMSDFLKDNPNATERETADYGRQLLDSIDNRFGETIVDNNFWHKAGYQMAQIMLLSPSWDIGTVREIGGGLSDIPKSLKGVLKGKGITDKTAYVAALAAFTALENGIMTKLKTGTDPDGADWFNYRTGGVNTDGTPERAQTASYMKDVMAAMHEAPSKMFVDKMNPGTKAAYELGANSDWRGDPIYPTSGYKMKPGDRGPVEYGADLLSPISVSQFTKGDKAGSNLSPMEKIMGTRPARASIQNTEKTEAQEHQRNERRWAKKRAGDARDKAVRAKRPAVTVESVNGNPYEALIPGGSDNPYAALVPK